MADNRQIEADELDAIEARCRAASTPPWEPFIEGRDHDSGDTFIRIGGLDDTEADMYVSRAIDQRLVPASAADHDFIAHARTDIPRLIAEIRRLRSELA
ncbi:hypothetical protein [Nocardia brasiliensis]|uniref:hypothetical protein n=1 Tax=Nocardia brasiliensis TaxID=37326 RepID=UPI00366C46AC